MLDEHFKPLPASLADFREMTAIGSGYFIVRMDGQDTAGVVDKDLEVVLPMKFRRVTGIGWGWWSPNTLTRRRAKPKSTCFHRIAN